MAAHEAPGAQTPDSAASAAYVANAECIRCHERAASAWQGSHHAQAMALPTPQTVRGNFQDSTFSHGGVSTRFFKRGEEYWVNTEGADGKLADFRVSYVFGLEPLQQYLLELPGGRLQALQVAWDVTRTRWFRLLPHEKAPPGDALHWTGRYQNANTMCIRCHTTGFEKGYDSASDTFATRWSEPNVSCQACHGPGQAHVAWAEHKARGEPSNATAETRYGLTVGRAAAGPEQVELCAPCHSRRSELTAQALPGEPRLDHYLPALLTPGLYFPDGQQRDEVYVDGSFRQSKMYQRGVGCTHCHDAHSGKPVKQGNALCTQCHATQPNPAFPSAAGAYDSPAHHFHAQGSEGAACVSCHMPATTYMEIQARPDHSLRIPRPDLSVKLGTPNACNLCHQDKSAQWAAQSIEKKLGKKAGRPPHYGEVFAQAGSREPAARAALLGLMTAQDQPSIVRASAVHLLAPDDVASFEAKSRASVDPAAEVRAAVADSLDDVPPRERMAVLVPLLRDPLRAVRMTAARALSSVPREELPPEARAAFQTALQEYIDSQNQSLDMPGAHLNLAVVFENTERAALAEKHYLRALALDPDFAPARANLSRLYNGAGRNQEAERVLKDGLAREPGLGELQYSLGLLLAEEGRLPEAAAALVRAAQLMPARAKVHYNLGLLLQQLRQEEGAEKALLTAQQLDAEDASIPYALAIFYAQRGRQNDALRWAQLARELAPEDPQMQELLVRLRGGR